MVEEVIASSLVLKEDEVEEEEADPRDICWSGVPDGRTCSMSHQVKYEERLALAALQCSLERELGGGLGEIPPTWEHKER